MKKLFALILALLMVFSMVACAAKEEAPKADAPAADAPAADAPAKEDAPADEPADAPAADEPADAPAADEPVQLGFTFFYFGDAFTQDVRSGVLDACAELGWEVNVQDANLDSATQINQMETFITQGVDAILFGTVDPDGLIPVCEDALAAGIPVFMINGVTTDLKGSTGSIYVDYYQSGYECGEAALEYVDAECGGKANAVILTNPTSKVVAAACENGFRDAVSQHAGVTIVAEQPYFTGSGSGRDTGMSVMENVMQTADIDLVYACAEQPVLGARDAMVAAGYEKAFCCATFWDEEVFKLIEANDPFFRMGSAQNPYIQAKELVYMAKTYLETGECEFQHTVPTDIITNETVQDYDWESIVAKRDK